MPQLNTTVVQDLLVIVRKPHTLCRCLFLIHYTLFLTVDNGKFNFLPGTIYVYKHSISTQTTFDKSKNTASIAEFNFKVHIHIKECDGFMFVSAIGV